MRARPAYPRETGFTYLTVLITIAIIGIVSTAAIQVGSIAQRRDAEEELLAIGMEFRAALASYAAASPPGQRQVPASMEELLRDPRFAEPRRHLRKLYFDPLTGTQEWGLLKGPDANGIIGIVGIYSLSEETPIKIGNFDSMFESFSKKTSYRYWVFTKQ
jgi:type II secretory pathway pseudopilin PulG